MTNEPPYITSTKPPSPTETVSARNHSIQPQERVGLPPPASACVLCTFSSPRRPLRSIDDPLIWGTLPLAHLLRRPASHRHALGSADICFTSAAASTFFALGQVHPTQRLHKSPCGGLFQPVLNTLPQLLDDGGWVHVFPEGRIYQHPAHQMRYFKWGVSRLLLEPRVQPVFVPMFFTGPEQVMSEDRGFPRPFPRIGKSFTVVYGDAVADCGFEDLRSEWRTLWEREGMVRVEDSEVLRTGKEAVELRIETARRVREEVLALRRRLGYPEEEPGADDPATYRLPGMDVKEGRLEDGTLVKDT